MLEFLFIVFIAFFIAVLFYKQANEQIQLLQLDAERLREIPNVLAERSPLIVRGYSTPPLGVPSELSKRPSAAPLLANPSPSARIRLAQESGLNVWFEQTWLTLLTPRWLAWITTPQARLVKGSEGLWKTTAPLTFIMPTQGEFTFKLLQPAGEPFLPTRYFGRSFDSLTLADTPLLSQLKYLELKLRKGHLLFLPPHLILDTTPSDEDSWIYYVELHHPISAFAKRRQLGV
jgi:hypothetical protein